ncbi:MAG: aldo/keto reductase [Erysipelotrichaceae bacterium]|nr:aldo/keto reductase [Erysipelotrichaceae bacterium]
MDNYSDKNKMKLGFGLMRLPKLEDGSIDVAQTAEMADLFLEAGGTYFDTAFMYPGSEEAIRDALIKRHPRDSFTLATKLMCSNDVKDEETAKQEFYTSLERTQAGYFDYYLLHALQRSNYQKYDEYHIWDFVKEQKEKGLIRHYGFSFHGDPELLEELLSKHPDVDFVQLQINYADWENPGVNSKKNLEICRSHGKLVTVMEPVKGGILADPIDSVKAIFDSENKDASYASWGIRFVASQEGILIVLSGMSNLDQMKDNLSFMKDFVPLNEHEQELIMKAQEALNADQMIPCTGCRYCTKGCPMSIPIPDIFTVENRKKGSPEFRTKREYTIVTQGKGKASDCLECGQCEGACPQHLPIIDLLKQCRALED